MELRVHPVDSADDPALLPYRTMREQRDHHRQRIFVAEGEKVVRRLLESRVGVVSLLLPEHWLRQLEPVLRARPEPLIEAFVAEKAALEKLTGFSMYQGVLAVGRVPEPVQLDEVLAGCPRPWLFVAMDGLSNAENLGGVVRNCAGFGVQALLVGQTTGHPYLRRAVRASMGTVFRLPVVEPADLAATFRELRRLGVRVVGAHPHSDQRRLSQAMLTGDLCIVLGSEGDGLSRAVLDACDDHVVVPMPLAVDSLNVGSAAAVFLYETARQRGRV